MDSNRTTREVQQQFAETLGYGQEIIWDMLSSAQSDILKAKIEQLIPDERPNNDSANNAESKKKSVAIKESREKLFNSIWEQRKYTNGQSLTSIIYVLVATDVEDVNRAEKSKKWSCHPVIRARRCFMQNNNADDSSECCMIFVDDIGRVYQNWKEYYTTNKLPEGVMVAPQNGIYSLNDNRVELDKHFTPASSFANKALSVLDTTSMWAGLASICVPIAALVAIPVAAPVAAVAAGVGLATAGYSGVRSASELVDRSQHEESISLSDPTARGHWISAVGSGVGLGAAGATKALSMAATTGAEVGNATKLTVNSINICSLTIAGTGLATGVVDLFLKYKDDKEVTTIDVLQLSASLVLFTHSVYNFRLANTIISETQDRTIAGYRRALSNRQRRAFDKISKETIRIRGNNQGKMDIIRNTNGVPSKQQFNDLFKINKNLNDQKIRPAFASGTNGITLNDQVTITNTQELRASVQHNQGPDILGQVTSSIPDSFTGTNQATSGKSSYRMLGSQPTSSRQTSATDHGSSALGVQALRLTFVVINGVNIYLNQFGNSIFDHISSYKNFEDLVVGMAEHFSEDIFKFIINLSEVFIDTMVEKLEKVLRFFISSETVIFQIMKDILENYPSNLKACILELKATEIMNRLKAYFLLLNSNGSESPVRCQCCTGYYRISKI